MKNKIPTIFAMLLLFAGMVTAFSLPDTEPVVIFSSSTEQAEIVAVITVAAVDTLENAGINKIELFRDNTLLDTKTCDSSTCIFIKTITSTAAASHNYYAKVKDLGNHIVQTNKITITFNGIPLVNLPNHPPWISNTTVLIKVINASDNSYIWQTTKDNILITYRNLIFEADAADPDNDTLEFEWRLAGPAASLIKSTIFNYEFTIPGDYNLTLTVNDTNGGIETSEWKIQVIEPLIYGTVYDIDTGQPLSDINISVYNASVYDVFNDTGNYSSLEPKEIPDTITDKNGNYLIGGPLAGLARANLVFKGSDEKDFNIHVETGKSKRHDVELDEDRIKTNLNAEGHILYSGKYEGSNNYTCGDKVKFAMFGVNNGGTDETITFAVQDHTSIGGPTAPVIYTGNISNPDEQLIVPAGDKTHGVFEYTLNCPLTEGRHDIHVVWDNSQWHKIGNFFVVGDTTSPEVNGETEKETYTNQSVLIGVNIVDTAQIDTIRTQEFSTMGDASNLGGITVYIHKDTNTSDMPLNDIINNKDSSLSASSNFDLNLTYNESGHYTAGIFAVDGSGNIGEHFVNVDVYITEEEADVIGDAIYTLFGLDIFGPLHDYAYTVTTSSPNVFIEWDRFTDDDLYGDEYITATDGFDGTNGINLTQIVALEQENYGKTGPEYAKPIYSMTKEEYNYSLTSFFYWLKCGTNPEIGLGGPSCNTTNFAPEIWKHDPTIEPSTSTEQGFSISVVDPNNDTFSIYWYDDDTLITNTIDHNQTYLSGGNSSLTFIANSSLVGTHIIKVIALDSIGTNVSIKNGPHNSQSWALTVTE